MNWNRRIATLAGLALLALTNAVALGGAAWNRSGAPDATLHLTQRELKPPYVRADAREDENSGLALRLSWRTLPAPSARHADRDGDGDLADEGGPVPGWLDARKMQALGFSTPGSSRTRPDRDMSRLRWQTSRPVLIVLELDGPASQEAVRRAQARAADIAARQAHGEGKGESQPLPVREAALASRLFAVDAGLDAAALRAAYPDRTRYAIVHGRVAPRIDGGADAARGSIQSIDADAVNVPLAWRGVLEGIRPSYDRASDEPSTHFQATVAFGQRFEPWLLDAARR